MLLVRGLVLMGCPRPLKMGREMMELPPVVVVVGRVWVGFLVAFAAVVG